MHRKGRLMKAKNFAVYYGRGMEEELAQFDIAIVEPSAYDAGIIKTIQQSGTLVLAYLSVMELLPSSPLFELTKEEDFIKIDGKLLRNEEYGTVVVDIRSKRWSSLLYQKIGRLLLISGYDGIFMDTIGDAESSQIPADIADLVILAAVNFIQRIKNDFKDFLITQNNGLEKLCKYTSCFIDGICWENPVLSKPESSRWSQRIIKRLKILKEEKLKVLLLIEDIETKGFVKCKDNNNKLVLEAAQKNGFLLYRAPFRYTGGINLSNTTLRI